MKLSEIKINHCFAKSMPNPEKVANYKKIWEETHKQSAPIVVTSNNFLIDGYIQYLILKENNIEDCEVEVLNKQSRTYVFGKHPGNEKVYVWKVPNRWNNFKNTVKPGDVIICRTTYGKALVIVDKVKTLNDPPINLRIKQVASQDIFRDGIELKY